MPFLWGKVRDLSAGFLLSVCYAGCLTVFQLCNIVWLWMLLTGSGNEFCRLLSALYQAVAYYPPTASPSAFPGFVYWKFPWRSAPCTFPLLWWAQSTLPPLPHVLFSSLFITQVFVWLFLWGRDQSAQGLCWFIPGVAVGILHAAYLLTCWAASPQAGLEPVSDSTEALLFSQCKVAWRSCVPAGGSGCQSFHSSWCYFSAKCGSSIAAKFWTYRAHAFLLFPSSGHLGSLRKQL
jgi:hypothetical protein